MKNKKIYYFHHCIIIMEINMDKLIEKIDNMSIQIINKLDTLEARILNIEHRLGYSNACLQNENLKELKIEKLESNSKDIHNALQYRDYRSIIYLMKKIYKNTENGSHHYPIRITGKRSYEYYENKQWIPDLYGHHIINTISLNMQNLFLQHNNLDEFDRESFMLNQQFIYKLTDDKYKRLLFKNIVEEIRINSFDMVRH